MNEARAYRYRGLTHDSEAQRKRAIRHGFYGEPWYSSYKSMMERCTLPTANRFDLYGGRGICVCEEWHDISNFAKWVEESGFKIGLTIDRINVNGNYSPENCRWATAKEQANNRNNTLRYTYNGETHTLAEWSEIVGINRLTLYTRLKESGWPVEKALFTKPSYSNRV